MSLTFITTLIVCFISVFSKLQSTAATDDTVLNSFPFLERHRLVGPGVALHWSISNDLITFGLSTIYTQGWIGMGISMSNGGMKGSDIWVLRKVNATNPNEKYTLEDRFAIDSITPMLDFKTDVNLLTVEISNGILKATFERPLSVCNPKEDHPIVPGYLTFIFAFGKSHKFDPHPLDDTTSAKINLFATSLLVPPEKDLLKTTVQNSPFIIPTEKTSYMCSLHMMPIDRKYHVVQVNPIIKGRNVHHMIAFQCDSTQQNIAMEDINRIIVSQVGKTQNCDVLRRYLSNMNTTCYTFWSGWGLGAQGNVMPLDSGLPMGKCDSCCKTALLEIHYDNPQMVDGVEDSSGFEFTYTSTLRSQDIGTWMIGTPTQQILKIPPNMQNFEVVNECPPGCTQRIGKPMRVLAVANHMHKLGRQLWTIHINASGHEQRIVSPSMWYDFNHQGSDPLHEPFYIQPGDRLIQHCVFSSEGINEVTYGGEGSNNEMCLTFFTYTPAMPWRGCIDISRLDSGSSSLNEWARNQSLCLPTQDPTINLQKAVPIIRQSYIKRPEPPPPKRCLDPPTPPINPAPQASPVTKDQIIKIPNGSSIPEWCMLSSVICMSVLLVITFL